MTTQQKSVLKLGTRKSKLALAQSTWVARQLEQKHPNLTVELVGIETTGDRIQDKPLYELDGKHFFTAELDHALLNKQVDFTVHSFKDLALDRPEVFQIGAIPKRELPHDVIFFSPNAVERMKQGLPLRIGTSAPRRNAVLPSFLQHALPVQNPKLEWIPIRGNINTRFMRIFESEDSDKKIDAVVLALAGVERLIQSEEYGAELKPIIQSTRKMILPLNDCPTAPAQGALAVECAKSDQATFDILKTLHDANTEKSIHAERAHLRRLGGGCHLALGVTQFYPEIEHYAFSPDVNANNVERSPDPHANTDNKPNSKFYTPNTLDVFDINLSIIKTNDLDKEVVFIAHKFALQTLDKDHIQQLQNCRVWVAGPSSWKAAAEKGLWVEGSVEGQGEHWLETFLNKTTLQLGSGAKWVTLTHSTGLNSTASSADSNRTASSTDKANSAVATYSKTIKQNPHFDFKRDAYFWKSGSLFEAYLNEARRLGQEDTFRGKIHACGPGKTLHVLRSQGVTPEVISQYFMKTGHVNKDQNL